jgi:putative serine protease PepD
VKHAYLGIQVDDSASPAGAHVVEVVSGSAAAKAGLKAGDVVVEMDGKAIASADDLSSVIDAHQPGDRNGVTYLRGGKRRTTTIALGTRPS